MKVFLTKPDTDEWRVYFPPELTARLEKEHTLTRQTREDLPEAEWINQMKDAQAVITHWGTPRFDAHILDQCPKLRIIAHAAGSVAGVCSDEVFARGLTVLSANSVMCRYVAEAILGHLIYGLRDYALLDRRMKHGDEWPDEKWQSQSLYGAWIGFVGLGMVGRELLNLLSPFVPAVSVYDPYIGADALKQWPFATKVNTIDEALVNQDAISLHASKTRETFHILSAPQFAVMRMGTLIVNCARGALIDETAMEAELKVGRLRAALDVYEQEPLPSGSSLRGLDNAVLIPHKGGAPAREKMTEAIIEDLDRIERGLKPRLVISFRQYQLMTHENL